MSFSILLKFILTTETVGDAMETPVRTAFATLSLEQLLGRPLNNIEQKFAPPQLYVACGKEIPIPGPRTAIVGSRKATREGIEVAARIASFLAKKE